MTATVCSRPSYVEIFGMEAKNGGNFPLKERTSLQHYRSDLAGAAEASWVRNKGKARNADSMLSACVRLAPASGNAPCTGGDSSYRALGASDSASLGYGKKASVPPPATPCSTQGVRQRRHG